MARPRPPPFTADSERRRRFTSAIVAPDAASRATARRCARASCPAAAARRAKTSRPRSGRGSRPPLRSRRRRSARGEPPGRSTRRARGARLAEWSDAAGPDGLRFASASASAPRHDGECRHGAELRQGRAEHSGRGLSGGENAHPSGRGKPARDVRRRQRPADGRLGIRSPDRGPVQAGEQAARLSRVRRRGLRGSDGRLLLSTLSTLSTWTAFVPAGPSWRPPAWENTGAERIRRPL